MFNSLLAQFIISITISFLIFINSKKSYAFSLGISVIFIGIWGLLNFLFQISTSYVIVLISAYTANTAVSFFFILLNKFINNCII